MKFKEKLKYISNRALVLGTVVFGSFIILAVIQLLLAYKGETPWWMAIIITIFAILFPIVFWLWIHRPYMRCEKMTDRFLDGYIFSEKEDMELLNLTPSIQKQMKMVDRIVRSPQYMDLNKRQAWLCRIRSIPTFFTIHWKASVEKLLLQVWTALQI